MAKVNIKEQLQDLGLNVSMVHYQLASDDLIKQAIDRKEAVFNDTGALVIDTGKFTGRAPKDKFIVRDEITDKYVEWGGFNQAIEAKYFDQLLKKLLQYLGKKNEVWVRDVYAGADLRYRRLIRVINENPAHNLFVSNMFLNPESEEELLGFQADWLVIQSPSFQADPVQDGVNRENFAIINFSKKIIIIGGTGYTGEIKKGVFTVLNFVLPVYDKVLSMHCSANQGATKEDVALFFGLSGTGKTTLSASAERQLVGDDEHGWTDSGVFNFEGGCYAKCVNLTEDQEPFIFRAIRKDAILENVRFFKDTNTVDYTDISLTENTRVSYPLSHIPNALCPSVTGIPRHIFFLTCDAFGILPPVAKLNVGQAMYHFLSGYTAKVAGTEEGVKEPQPVFSYCFGAPFLPLSPLYYAKMLGEKLKTHNSQVWLINTGWIGGAYGVGSRIKLKYTRAIVNTILQNKLLNVPFKPHPIFHVSIPESCDGVPTEILNPINTWEDKQLYAQKAYDLARLFHKNFEKYISTASVEILEAQPLVS